MRGSAPIVNATPMTEMVKKIIILNVVIWFFFVMIIQKFFLSENYVFEFFGLIPISVVTDFYIWQPLTYMFLHSTNFFHILFNMLILWMFGSELESRWGSGFFLKYYLFSGFGAAIIYVLATFIYSLITAQSGPMLSPVIGASGATFALILAYGLIFGERTILFMFLFPMKAKYFALLLGAIELMTLLESGYGGQVSNLCHLTGLLSGFIFLKFSGSGRGANSPKSQPKSKTSARRKLRLVVDNESEESENGPRYWN